MRGASPREICLTSRSQASSSTRAGREQAPGERPGRDGPACSKDDTATEARVRAAAESGELGWWGAGVEKSSWLRGTAHRGLPRESHILGRDAHLAPQYPSWGLPIDFVSRSDSRNIPLPPALWTSPLPVSRALSVRSPRALMSRKGLFPMPMETICCTRSSREQRPCLLLSLGPPASVSAQPCSLSGLFLNSHTSLLSFDCQGMDWDSK